MKEELQSEQKNSSLSSVQLNQTIIRAVAVLMDLLLHKE